MLEETSVKATLELKINFENGADAAQSGAVLSRLAGAYSGHCNRLGVKGARLVVRKIEIASLWALLEGVVELSKGVRTLYENRALLESFVLQLGGVVMAIHNGHPNIVPSHMRSLVRALIGAMQKGNATKTTIKVTGADGALFEIESAEAALLEKALKVGKAAVLDQKALQTPEWNEIFHAANLPLKIPVIYRQTDALTYDRAWPHLQGTLVFALGSWYVRAATLGGIMLPAEIAGVAEPLDPKGTYLVSGAQSPTEGAPRGFIVQSIHRRLS
ncbi:hypothetical protein [Novosphingobium sp. SG707]|uniref:hypothetical protein n=1 Tax=Novosphingobium sp. SG707 TaxID=2586996 RepID=UPI0014481A74|nr:hypothetical protein [Novosphingobium sp. SG707]NKI99708.1 hypothetical protein [Novosphingobium sp. SG707]